MLRCIFITVLIITGLSVVITAEPTYRRYARSLIDENTVTIDCVGSHAESSECRSVSQANQPVETPSSVNVTEEEKSWNFADLFDDTGDEARGKKGKKKGYGRYVIVMAAAAKATLMYVMIHAVAALAAKALVVAKVALALAAALALKKALEHQDKTSVEIIKHPQHSYVQTHSSSVDYDHHGGYEGHRRRRRYAR